MGSDRIFCCWADIEASLLDPCVPGPWSWGAPREIPFALAMGSFWSFLFSPWMSPLCAQTWKAIIGNRPGMHLVADVSLITFSIGPQKKFFFNVPGTKKIYKRKSLQYFTWDCADNDKFLFFFFSSIYSYSIKLPPNNSEPTTISEHTISVFVAHHMFEVWHNPYGTHSICCFPTSMEAVKSVSF